MEPTSEQQTDGRSDTGATDEKGRTERRKGVGLMGVRRADSRTDVRTYERSDRRTDNTSGRTESDSRVVVCDGGTEERTAGQTYGWADGQRSAGRADGCTDGDVSGLSLGTAISDGSRLFASACAGQFEQALLQAPVIGHFIVP